MAAARRRSDWLRGPFPPLGIRKNYSDFTRILMEYYSEAKKSLEFLGSPRTCLRLPRDFLGRGPEAEGRGATVQVGTSITYV